MVDLRLNGPEDAPVCLILAHGAGAAMDTPFMTTVAEGVAAQGILCVRFEFPYMARRRVDGVRRPPDRAPVLLSFWADVVSRVRARISPSSRLFIGGKSMGGRMATLCATELGVDGVIVLGYPFYAAGKPVWSDRRLGHLTDLSVPTLVCQGERDALGDRAAVEALCLSPQIQVVWLPDGDHSLKPRKASGYTEAENLSRAIAAMGVFLRGAGV